VLFNISPLQDQTSVLLLTESISLCMPLQILIRLSLNAFYVTLRVQQPMAYILLIVLLLRYMDLQIKLGR
jgi:hypothetical protein